MCALSIIGANLVSPAAAPVTAHTGGTSKGNAGAGNNPTVAPGSTFATSTITTADRAGAGVLTVLLISVVVGGCWWLCV
jgi:mannan endo-1,6-alpha-mannosidase